MNRRISQALKVLAVFVVVGGLTWALSWGLQYLSGALTLGPEFRWEGLEANRLAAVTVLTTLVIVVVVELVTDMDGCSLYIFLASFSIFVSQWLGGKALEALSGTAVSTVPAQIIYCIIAVLWSLLVWYVLHPEDKKDGSKADKNAPRTDDK